jgi:RNA polymerase sigma-70 factor, ECF subfamily
MEALTPAERVSFVLHDVFEIPFDVIAAILGRSIAATKMLASRARGRIRLGTPAMATDAAARARTGARLGAAAHPVLVDGMAGVLITMSRRPVTVMAFTVTGGATTAIHMLTDPDQLAQVVPSWIV